MRKLFLFLIVAFAFTQASAQYIHKIKADSVLITNDSCTAELNLENSTKHIKGFLYNRGNGRTEFRKAVKLNDSTFIFGDDTLLLGGNGKNFANADLTLTGNRKHTLGDDTLNLNAIVGGDTTQYTQSAKQISITGNLAGLNWGSLLNVNATGWKQDAITANSYGGTAVIGRNSTWGGTAIGGYSNGIGIYATSSDVSAGVGMLNGHGLIAGYYGPNAHGAGLGVYRSSTEGINAVRPMIRMLNNPQIYAANAVGMGSSIRWEFPSYANNGAATMFHSTAELYVKMTNLRGATTTSEMGFNAMGDSTIRTIMTLDGHGNIALPNYGGTNWQVNDASGYKALVVDNAGNVRKGSWTANSNLATAGLTANGNYAHNWNHKQLNIDSVSSFRMFSMETDPSYPNLKTKSFLTLASDYWGIGPTLGTSLRNAANTEDSISSFLWFWGSQAELESTKGGIYAAVKTTANMGDNLGAVDIIASNSIMGKTSGLSLNASRLALTGNDSIVIKGATPAASADSVYAPGPILQVPFANPNTNKLLKIPVSSLVQNKQSFAQTATATVASTNSELSLVSTGTGSLTIPASAWFAGKTFRISVRGVYSTSASDPAGVTIKIKLGSTVIAQSVIFLGTGKTDAAYEMRIDLTCRATGASGSLFTMGMFYNDDDGHSRIDNGTAATSINLSSGQTLDITATPTDDAAGNSFTAFIVTLEAIN